MQQMKTADAIEYESVVESMSRRREVSLYRHNLTQGCLGWRVHGNASYTSG